MRSGKRVISVILVAVLLLSACLYMDSGSAAAANGQTEVTVTGVKSGHNGQIVTFTLSGSDYPAVTVGIQDKHTEYSYWDDIKIYTGDTEYKTLKEAYTDQKYYSMWGMANTVSIQLTSDVYSAATKIEIPAGTVFPSYAYTNSGSATKGGYVTTEDIIFVKPSDAVEGSGGYDWTAYVPMTEEETGIARIQLRDASAKLLFFLSNQDYSTVTATTPVGDRFSEYNTLDNIVICTETESKTLRELFGSEKYYNIWGESGSVAFDLDDAWNGTTVKKIVVKEGCQFPSAAYTNGSGTKKAYVVKQEVVFTTNTSATDNTDWTAHYPEVVKDSSVGNIHIRGGKLLLFLTEHDYPTGVSTETIPDKIADYNIMDNIVLYKSETESATLASIYAGERYYNIWGEKGVVAFSLNNGYDGSTVTKVVVKAGCQFPSYSYTNDNAAAKTSYVIPDDTVFTNGNLSADSVNWTRMVVRTTEVTVTGVAMQNKAVTLSLSESDYAPEQTGTYANIVPGDKHTDYNYWKNVRVYTDASTYKTLGDACESSAGKQKYYNMWTIWNSISVELDADSYANAVRIVIPEGTVFPSYQYTNVSQAEKNGYEVVNEMMFVKQADGTWKDCSLPVSKVNGDANGDGTVDVRDIVCQKNYVRYGYGHNKTSDCDGDGITDETDILMLRRFLVGKSNLYTYVKESSSLMLFSSTDSNLDFF